MDKGLYTLLLLSIFMNFLEACASLVYRGTFATDTVSLFLPYANVDVDVLRSNPQRAVRRMLEPTINLPRHVQDTEKMHCRVEFQKVLDTERVTAYWINCDIEQGDECKVIDSDAYLRASSTE